MVKLALIDKPTVNFSTSPTKQTLKMKRTLLLFLLLVSGLLQQAWAQDRTISGKVIDRATNQGLPGVTVLVKGTTVGTGTNADGGFSLSVPSTATTLVFSFIGYASQEQTIGGSNNIDVALAVNLGPLPLTPGTRYTWRMAIDGESQSDWVLGFTTRPMAASRKLTISTEPPLRWPKRRSCTRAKAATMCSMLFVPAGSSTPSSQDWPR